MTTTEKPFPPVIQGEATCETFSHLIAAEHTIECCEVIEEKKKPVQKPLDDLILIG